MEPLVKQEARSPNAFRELGATGLRQSGGYVLEEWLPKLRTLQERVRMYSEMLADPTVGAVVFAFEQFARGVAWSVEPGEDTPRGESLASFVDANMHGMSHTWQDFLTEALSMVPYGFSVHELVYERRRDGRVYWRKLPIRSQDSIDRWEFDDSGGLRGVWQSLEWSPGKMGQVFIPIEKLLLFRPSTSKNDPEGRSALRSAVKPYTMKKRIEMIEAIGIERDLAGVPRLKVPDELFLENDLAKSMRAYAEDVITRVRKDDMMGVVIPTSWEFDLVSAAGSRALDTDKVIGRYDARIAQSVLADVILMGHSQVGSYALSEVKADIFARAIQAWLDEIAEVLNQHAIPRLLALNGIRVENPPRITHGPIAVIDVKTLADTMFRLAGIDALRPDTPLRKYLRTALGLPPEDEEEQRAMEQAIATAQARESLGRMLSGRPDNETRTPAL